ncbi:MAG: NUDIX hydrolase [Candidatus Angelobacter sp.]
MATSPAPIVPVDSPVIKAAGGILHRSTSRGDEVMVVYRKRHQDWTLPRGKVKDGESFQEAAMREVLEETGCSCRIGNYLGTISYSDKGIPKVVLFWKMTLVEEKGSRNTDEIGEAVWLQLPAAVDRLTHTQEKTLLSRIGSLPKPTQSPSETPAVVESQAAPAPRRPSQPSAVSAAKDNRAHSRLLREAEAFRVELGFLERRNLGASNSWAVAAQEQLDNVQRSLESNDVEGGWFSLHAAQRYAVFGMNQTELANRACILREEALKMSSWRAETMENLLTVSDDRLTAECVADALALRNEDYTDQNYKTRVTGDQLRILLMVCGLAAVALTPFMFLPGRTAMVADVLFFGLLGAAFCSVQSLILGRNESRIPNSFVTLTPVLFGAIASLAGYAIYEYMALFTFNSGERHTSAVLAISFLFGCLGQRLLARIASGRRQKKIRA